MKYLTLKESEPIESLELFLDNKAQKKVMETFISTDGTVQNELTIDYGFGWIREYPTYHSDHQEILFSNKRDLFFRNANYIIKALVGVNDYGNDVKLIQVYLKDPKDKTVLLKVKEELQKIYSTQNIKSSSVQSGKYPKRQKNRKRPNFKK